MPDQMSPQEALQFIAREMAEQSRLLKSIRLQLIVIAIPFWLALCSIGLVVALYVLGALALAGGG